MAELSPSSRATKVVALVSVAIVVSLLGVASFAFWGGARPFSFYDIGFYRRAVAAVGSGTTYTYDALSYPPFVFLILWVLLLVPTVLGDQLWTFVTLMFLVAVAVVLSMRGMAVKKVSWRQHRWELVIWSATSLLLLLVSSPALSQFTNGQLSLVVMALAFVDTANVLPRRLRGVLVGLAGAIKVTPLVFVLYYLVTGQRRQAAVASATFVGLTALAWAVFPVGSLQFWTRVGGSSQFGDPARSDNWAIRSMLTRLSPEWGHATWLWALLGLAVVVAALWRSRRHYQRGEVMESALTVGAAATVVAPIAWPHYFLWLPVTAVWLITTQRPAVQRLGWAIFVVYSPLYFSLLVPLLASTAPAFVSLIDLLVVIPMLIGFLGLPRRRSPRPVTPAATDGSLARA